MAATNAPNEPPAPLTSDGKINHQEEAPACATAVILAQPTRIEPTDARRTGLRPHTPDAAESQLVEKRARTNMLTVVHVAQRALLRSTATSLFRCGCAMQAVTLKCCAHYWSSTYSAVHIRCRKKPKK